MTLKRRKQLTRLLAAGDTLALVSALLVYVVASSMRGQAALQPRGLALFGAMLPAWLVSARLYGLYRLDGRPAMHRTVHEWVSLGHLVVIGTGAFLVVALATRIVEPAPGPFVVFALSAIAFVTAGRMAIRALARRWDGYAQSAVIVGAGEIGQLVARKLLRHPEYGINLVGFVDTPPAQRRPDIKFLIGPLVPSHDPARSLGHLLDLTRGRLRVTDSDCNCS